MITMIIKELTAEDKFDGLYETLSNFTEPGYLTKEILKKMNDQDIHVFVVIEDDRIVGTISVIIEQKVIHSLGKVSHIEDVSVDKEYGGKGIGKLLMNKAIDYSRERGCYKIILDCDESLIPFYSKFGFEAKEVQMRLDLKR